MPPQNPLENARNASEMRRDDEQGDHKITSRHDRNDHIQRADRCIFLKTITAESTTRMTVVIIGEIPNAFLNADATELLMTWLIPPADQTGQRKQNGNDGVFQLFLTRSA